MGLDAIADGFPDNYSSANIYDHFLVTVFWFAWYSFALYFDRNRECRTLVS